MRKLQHNSEYSTIEWHRLPFLLTEKEAASVLNVSVSYLRLSRSEGVRGKRTPAPKYVKIGKSVRYKKDELQRWVNALPERTVV